MTISQLNQLSDSEATDQFQKCCGSIAWASKMSQSRPFSNRDQLLKTASTTWKNLQKDDQLEAFRHHPRIGDLESIRKRFASTQEHTSQEQSGVQGATEETLQGLQTGNKAYENQFGHVFLVCATGKSAEEMLKLLRERIKNDPETEFEVAVNEQEKITAIRLKKWIES